MSTQTNFSRRNFLKVSMLAGGGMMVGFSTVAALASPVKTPVSYFTPNAFISIGADGAISLFSPNPEIGQGVKTSLPMIMAEELGIDWKKISVELAPFDQKFGRQMTGGSGAVRSRYTPLRQAGATARVMLIAAAAQTWNVDAKECRTENGFVIHTSGKKASFGELATLAASLPVPTDVALKNPAEFKLLGTRVKDVDAHSIVTGQPLYGIDTKRKGMLYAVVARTPTAGKKLQSFDDSETLKVNGVKKVVKVNNSVAVLATSTWAAMKGRKALKIEWLDEGKLESTTEHTAAFAETLKKPAQSAGRKDGDFAAALAGAKTVIEATYEVPVLAHGQMEPLNFFADVTDGKADLYGPTQVPQALRDQVAKELKIAPEKVTLSMPRQGGGFGRKLQADNGIEAALISAAAQAPVQVQWTREDDMQNDAYRASGMYNYKAILSDNELLGCYQSFVGLGGGRSSDAYPAGSVPHFQMESQGIATNIRTGPWRAPGANIQAFASESFMDEIATALKKDPIALRLELFKKAEQQPVGKLSYEPAKFRSVVELVHKMSNWDKPLAKGRFRGFATWYSFSTYVAHVVELSVNNGEIRVEKVYSAVNCGRVVNLSGAENQVQGAVIDGLGHAMYSKITFDKGVVQEQNFDKYRFLRMRNAPVDVVVNFVPTDDAPTGLGEPGLPPIAPAVANALFAATGKRYRKMPFDDAG